MSLRLAVATEDLNPSLKRAIGLAAAMEVPGVRLNARNELDVGNPSESALRQTLLYVKERQMNVAGLSCPTRHSLYDEQYLDERLDVILRSMSLVRKLGTTELLVRCGDVPNPDSENTTQDNAQTHADDLPNPFSFTTAPQATRNSPQKEFALLSEILNDLTRHGNHVGCVLCLQVPAYNQPLLHKLLSNVKEGPLKIVFDPATAVMSGSDTIQTYRDLYSTVGYIRARDAVCNVDGAGTEVGVGRGVVDWMELIPTLIESDYQNWVCIERTGGDDRTGDIQRGVSELKTLIPQTGD